MHYCLPPKKKLSKIRAAKDNVGKVGNKEPLRILRLLFNKFTGCLQHISAIAIGTQDTDDWINKDHSIVGKVS